MNRLGIIVVAAIVVIAFLIPSGKKELKELPGRIQYWGLETEFTKAAKEAYATAAKILPADERNTEYWQKKLRLISEAEQARDYYRAADYRRSFVYSTAKWVKKQPLSKDQDQEERNELVHALDNTAAELQALANITSNANINYTMSWQERNKKLSTFHQQFRDHQARFEEAHADVQFYIQDR